MLRGQILRNRATEASHDVDRRIVAGAAGWGIADDAGAAAPGETGVSVASVRFERGLHFSGIPQQHLVWFNLSPPDPLRLPHRGEQELRHEPPTGSLAICPAGVEGAADTAHTVDALVVAVDLARFSLAAAECSALGSRLDVRLVARDAMLLDVARRLASESDCCYINGPLFWSELAQHFIDGLLARFSRLPESCARGTGAGTCSVPQGLCDGSS